MTLCQLTIPDRIECFAALGVVLYIGKDGELRARGPRRVVDAAGPALAKHRAGFVACLRSAVLATLE